MRAFQFERLNFLKQNVENRLRSVVVRTSARNREVVGSNPGRVIPLTIGNLAAASPDVRHYENSAKTGWPVLRIL